MSSAVSSLKGKKRTPLPPVRRVSREVRSGSSLANFDVDEARDPSALDFSTRSAVVDELRRCRGGGGGSLPSLRRTPRPPGSTNFQQKTRAGASDADLVSSMAGRLAMVERELLAAKREVIEKDAEIAHLEKQVAILSIGSRDGEGEVDVRELKQRCLEYQKQISEMEEFLNDYGMMWVGKEEDVDGREPGDRCPGQVTVAMWNPATSVTGNPTASSTVMFDTIVKNIKELNVLAGEGQCEVARSGLSARLQPMDPIPLTLYQNGLAMHSGPFRPYSDPLTRQFVIDLQDGYFPSELKHRYPEGIPFQLNDMRDKMYLPSSVSVFHGGGHRLGGQCCPSRLLPQGPHVHHPLHRGDRCHGDNFLEKQSRTSDTTSELPEKPVSLDTFLKRLPANVLKNGRLINIRSDIEKQMKLSTTDAHGKVIVGPEPPTASTIATASREGGGGTPSTSCEDMCTLRIKSEKGDTTYVLKLQSTETIGTLKEQLNKLRPSGSCGDYVLRCNYPRRVLSDDDASLHQVGLFSSANLFIEPQSWT